MKWHFQSSDDDAAEYKDPTAYSVTSQGRLTRTEIFAREVSQNGLDAAAGDTPVRLKFRLVPPDPDRWKVLRSGLDLEEIDIHTQRALEEVARHGIAESNIDRPGPEGAWTLIIEDQETIGLVGPDHNADDTDDAKRNSFLALCKNTGDNQKGTAAGGGTYGFGKGVLWKHSAMRTVVFHSRLSEPHDKGGTGLVTERFFGRVRLPSHRVEDSMYNGDGFFGSYQDERKYTAPLINEQAAELAAGLGFVPRDAESPGTSIAILGFVDPDEGRPPEDPARLLSQMRKAVEDFFWPAIVEKKLEVEFEIEGGDSFRADPEARSHLKPFINAYVAALPGDEYGEDEGFLAKRIEVRVPRSDTEPESTALVRLAVALTDEDQTRDDDEYRNRVALIRGSGMVIGYHDFKRRGLTAMDYHAVALGGTASHNEDPGGDQAQKRLEELLARAEPVTHDRWHKDSEQLQGWRGAKSRVRELLIDLRKSLEEATTESREPEGAAAPLLRRLFPLDTEPGTGSERTLGIEFDPSEPESEDGQTWFPFSVRVAVPSIDDAEGEDDRWRARFRYGVVAESSGGHAVRDYLRIQLKTLDDEAIDRVSETPSDGCSVTRAFEAAEREYLITGTAGPIDSEVADLHQFGLEVVTYTGRSEE